ncbi:MAG TPA: hypothetical protein ACFYED_04485 [Candidatus Tripitaka californicus]|uniref:hypothetical protein n=1 Tax=Candidatus Tripitaka californicus TaxID=3367616 RepID=UPI0040289E2D|nr:hypothetical protein [Planctomycetota bacterium]
MAETSVKLDRLPPGVAIPNHLQTRYDPQNRLLIISDAMSEQELDELLVLSKEQAYRDAVKALFWKSRIEKLKEELREHVIGNGFNPESVTYKQGPPPNRVVYCLYFDVIQRTRYISGNYLTTDNDWVRQRGDKEYMLDASLELAEDD